MKYLVLLAIALSCIGIVALFHLHTEDETHPESTYSVQARKELVQRFVRIPGDSTLPSFEFGQTLITQLQWWSVMGENPSLFKEKSICPQDFIQIDRVSICPKHPVDSVTWEDAQRFVKKVSHLLGGRYDLPSLAQWEKAAKAGSKTRYFFGNENTKLADYAWFADNSSFKTNPVATKKPNPFGIYDVYGNLLQWVKEDHSVFGRRDLRGCGWYHNANECTSDSKNSHDAESRIYLNGIRLVRY